MSRRRPARRYWGSAWLGPVPLVPPRGPLVREGFLRVGLQVALVTALFLFGSELWHQLSTAELFRVRELRFSGVVQADEKRLARLADAEGQANLLALDLDGLRQRLLAEPWIEQARLARSLPDLLLVDVVEREAVAWEAREDEVLLLDASGRPIVRVAEAPASLPEIVLPTEHRARRPLATETLSAYRAARDHLPTPERLELGEGGGWTLSTAGLPPIHLNGPESVTRLTRFLQGARPWMTDRAAVSHLDARWRGRVHVGLHDAGSRHRLLGHSIDG
ncbi:MAG: FtsQ-type POTRA domain-containing protein [Acidobacteriota bacterium]